MVVAMNIINLDQEGDVVDPEDWSPERTQYVERLDPGDSTTLSWRVNAILDGDYVVYMVVMPEPAGRDATSQAVASAGIHLTVMPFTRLNPRGVVPLVIGTPLVLGLGTFLVLTIRRRETEGGAPLPRYLRPGVVAIAVVISIGALSAFAIGSQSAAANVGARPEASALVSPGIEPSPSIAVGQSSEPEASAGATPDPAASAGASPDPVASPSPPASEEAVALQVDTATEPEDFAYAETALTAPAGSTITLNNRTDMDDEIGHNWVLVEPGQEQAVLASGIAAGDDKDWLDVDDPAIIAHTALIEGEDSASVTFEAPPPGTYTFLCTFPEHYAKGMAGTLTIE
jgi:azurin